jgi:hypothetical protein
MPLAPKYDALPPELRAELEAACKEARAWAKGLEEILGQMAACDAALDASYEKLPDWARDLEPRSERALPRGLAAIVLPALPDGPLHVAIRPDPEMLARLEKEDEECPPASG